MIVVKHNKENIILDSSNDIRYLRYRLEELAYAYVNELQVVDFNFYPKSKSKKYGKCPYGYFMIADGEKITIYNKEKINGWVYNSYRVNKICTFTLIKPIKKIFDNQEEEDIEIDYRIKKRFFNGVHQELLEKLNVENKEN